MSDTKEVEILEDGTLSYSVWWKRGGGGMIRRDALELDHPEHPYNLLKRHGIVPENYGIYGIDQQQQERFRDWTKEALIMELCRLEKEVDTMMRLGM